MRWVRIPRDAKGGSPAERKGKDLDSSKAALTEELNRLAREIERVREQILSGAGDEIRYEDAPGLHERLDELVAAHLRLQRRLLECTSESS